MSSLTAIKDKAGIAKGVLGFQATRLLPPGSVSWCSWAKVSHAGRLLGGESERERERGMVFPSHCLVAKGNLKRHSFLLYPMPIPLSLFYVSLALIADC